MPKRSVAIVRGFFDVVTAIVTTAALLLPGVMSFRTDPAKAIAREQRLPAKRPELPTNLSTLAKFPKSFATWAADHYIGRTELIGLHNYVKLQYLEVSPIDSLIVGKDGWLFFTGNESLESYRGERRLAAHELQNWRSMLERRQDWLAARGIDFLFVVAPDKHTIYPDKMPAWIKKTGPQTAYEQLLQHLSGHTDIRMLDLRPSLETMRREFDVYYMHGTHWNAFGGYATYRILASYLQSRVPTRPPMGDDELKIAPAQGIGDSWAGRLHLEGLLHQPYWHMWRPAGHTWRAVKSPTVRDYDWCTEIADSPLPRAVFFHDSFMQNWMPWISEHFSRVVASWQKAMDWELVRRERPAVVVFEIVERMLPLGLNDPMPADHPWLPWCGDFVRPGGDTLSVRLAPDGQSLIARYAGGEIALARFGTGVFCSEGPERDRAELRFKNAKTGPCRTVSVTRRPYLDGLVFAKAATDPAAAATWSAWAGRYTSGDLAIDAVVGDDALFVFDARSAEPRAIVRNRDGGYSIEGSPLVGVALEIGADGSKSIVFGEPPAVTRFRKN